MNETLPDPTPVAGDSGAFRYRPPRLRVTATYDSDSAGTPTSLDVEVNDDDALPATLLLLVDGITAVLTKAGKPTSAPTVSGARPSGDHIIFHQGGRAA